MISGCLSLLLLAAVAFSCSPESLLPGDYTLFLQYDGLDREYILHVPPKYNHTENVPLVLALHGLGANDPSLFQNAISMDSVSDREGFLIAYPLGSPSFSTVLFGHSWNGGQLGSPGITEEEIKKFEETETLPIGAEICCLSKQDDLGYLKRLVEEIKGMACVDSKRVFAFGFSAGGVMSHRLACEASDVFRAVASFSGPVQVRCNPPSSVPLMHFHGTLDLVFPYNGLNPLFNGATDTLRIWSEINGCSGEPEVTYESGRVTEETFLKCAGNSTVSLITTSSGGHSWPPQRDINAEEHIWDFFSRQN